MTAENSKDWIQNLSERRIVQFFLTYVAVSWGLIQAIDWIVRRYSLNSSLVDMALIFFVALLPAIVLFIYHHGRPGHDEWQPIEKIAIPINLVLAIGLAGFLGYSNAESVIETIEVVQEDGTIDQRIIYNRSLNNRIIVYPTETEGMRGDDEWLNIGLPLLVEADLEQDPRITSFGPLSVSGNLKDYNKELLDKITFSMKRQIAEDRNVDHFIVPICKKEADQYEVSFTVYNTTDGKEIYNKRYINKDIFGIVDGFSVDFNEYLYSKLGDVEGVEKFADLPVRDLRTDNFSALIKYVKAGYISRIKNDLPAALELLDQAITEDPEFMSAYVQKGQLLGMQRDITGGIANFDKAEEFFTGQPERVILGIKTQKYMYQNDITKATRVGEMWQKLYPQNEEVYNRLNLIYSLSAEFDKKVKLWQDGYDAGHKGNFLIELGNIYSQKGEYDKAENYYDEYIKLYPSKQGEVSALGNLYLKQGKFDKGIEYFENLLLREEAKIDNHINVARSYLRKGDFEISLSTYTNALGIAKTAQDSFSIYSNLNNYYIAKGLSKDFLETDAKRMELFKTFAPPIVVDGNYYNFITIDRYRQVGGLEVLKPELDRIGNDTKVEDINWKCIVNYNLGLGSKNAQILNDAMNNCADDIERAITPMQKLLIGGLVDYINDKPDEALNKMNEYVEKSGQPRQELILFIGEINNAAGNYEENIKELTKYLISDNSDAKALYDLAVAYKGEGNISKAKETLQKALDIWKDADVDFLPAQNAQALMEEL